MRNLLQKPAAQVLQDLGRLDAALNTAFPLKAKHRKDLPDAVRELSALLTVDRGQKKAYWSSPRFLGAYLRYFLPWNLMRMAWLLPGLPLFPGGPGKVLDLGSGPLTFPLGLWLARPDLRGQPISFVCSDPAARPMEYGRDVYAALRGNEAGWPLRLVSLPLEKTLAQYRDKARLITSLNVFNEIGAARHESLEERLKSIFYRMDRLLEPGGQILIVEPGTRLGGKIIGLFRNIALEAGFDVEAPCPHAGPCPYAAEKTEAEDEPPAGRKNAAGRGRATGWCHFSHPVMQEAAGTELIRLSEAAGLAKDSLHLSCLLLRKGGADAAGKSAHAEKSGMISARIISDPIRLPGRLPARYGCSRLGLVLVEDSPAMTSGSLIDAPLPHSPQTDAKTGALLLRAAQDAERGKKRQFRADGPADAKAGAGKSGKAQNAKEQDGVKKAGRPSSRTAHKSGTGKPDAAKRTERPGKAGGTNQQDRPIRPDRPNRPAKPGKPVRPVKPEQPNQADRPNQTDRPNKTGKPDKSGAAQRAGGRKNSGKPRGGGSKAAGKDRGQDSGPDSKSRR